MQTKRAPRSTTYPRVLFFSPETALSRASRQLCHLLGALKGQGWEASFAAPLPGPMADFLEKAGVRVELNESFLLDPAREKLGDLCREFDLVVANSVASWPAVEAAQRENVPVIWYIHGTLPAAQFVEQIRPVREAVDLTRMIVVPAPQTARLLSGLTQTKIEIVPYGIPEPPKTTSTRVTEAITFVVLASFERRKGQDVLIEAIAHCDSKTQQQTLFKLAGEVLDRQFFSELHARAAALKNVEFIESLGHAEALRLLGSADALVCPSRHDTMPISIIEAASLSKTIISTDVGGIGEWIHDGLNGWLVPAGDAPALADAIVRCAQDRQQRLHFGAAARRTYERYFTLARFTNRFAALMREAIQPKASSSELPQSVYERWIAAFDDSGVSNRIELSRRVRRLSRHPLISILLPVYNPDLTFLEAAIDSVRNQIYERWELCIADDASTHADVLSFLKEIARRDARIKVVLRESNGHISACSNSALTVATGEWCALLDQDDALAENALAFVALEISGHPKAGVIYSDQDKIDNQGARANPFFKTDWNPQLFLGQNYINHLGVYRTSLVREIGGFREGYEGSQDYDLALRCIEKLNPEQIRHIPRILYHWRMVQGSVAAEVDAKPYAKEAGRRAIADHLSRCGISARVMPCPENAESHRVIYEVNGGPKVSIIIPTRDRMELLRNCISSLREKTEFAWSEIVVVDNDSVEKATHDYLRELVAAKVARVVVEKSKFNFSRLVNCGAAAARGDILAFLNNDIEINEPGWLREMVSHASRTDVGAVGARLWFPDNTLQHGGVILGLGGIAGHANHRIPTGHPGYFNRALLQQNYSAVTAACMLVRRKVFLDVGGFDEINFAINFSDVDFCLRLQKRGWQIVWTPYANLIHRESASRGYQRTPAEQAQFFREATSMQQKWGAELLCDPFYSPNFSLNWPGFGFAFPPRWGLCAGAAFTAA